MAVLRESDASYYMRQEADGLILGPYEKGHRAGHLTCPRRIRTRTVPPDLERLDLISLLQENVSHCLKQQE
ncbi:MAG: hypothetical protein Ct9H300mP28_00110 [Pseudomonadota bacterium]|nr:MAG: hypothetical protein Ct9H300mP28_00110 [Pseudomonadota bacterium]